MHTHIPTNLKNRWYKKILKTIISGMVLQRVTLFHKLKSLRDEESNSGSVDNCNLQREKVMAWDLKLVGFVWLVVVVLEEGERGKIVWKWPWVTRTHSLLQGPIGGWRLVGETAATFQRITGKKVSFQEIQVFVWVRWSEHIQMRLRVQDILLAIDSSLRGLSRSILNGEGGSSR